MPNVLEVADVSKSFGGVHAVQCVSFSITAPGIYGLIGPNGAGKTTLFDVICGRQFADGGDIRLAGTRIDREPVHRRTRLGLARTFQECRVLEEETCLDNVLFAAQNKRLGSELAQGISRRGQTTITLEAERLLQLVNLRHLSRERAGNLSFGQRRLLEIVSSLVTQPRLLLLDEPASGINPTLLNTLHDFLLRIFAERQIVLLIVEHNMEFIMSLASHILVMHQGRLLEQGPPDRIQHSQAVIEAYLG